MARPRNKKQEDSSRETELRKRAASRNYELVKERDGRYATIGGTRFGPLASLDEVNEFLPKDG